MNFFRALLTIVFCILVLAPLSSVDGQELRFIEPTGPFAVGTTTRQFIDESRPESFTRTNRDDKREVVVDFWYPAQVEADSTFAPYLPEAVLSIEGLANELKSLPPRLELTGAEFEGVTSFSYLNAPISPEQERYPVIIFSHGWGGFNRMYSTLLQELASYGYIVAAIEHTYGSAATVFPDGRVIQTIPSSLQNSSLADTQIWAADQSFVIDQLETLDADDPESAFTGRFDLDRIGVVGASFGSLAGTYTLMTDDRVKAGVSIYGGVSGAVVARGIDEPFLSIAPDSEPTNPSNFNRFRGEVYNLVFVGFDHANFSDAVFWNTPMPLLGTVEGERGLQITNAYVLEFLNHVLLGADAPLLQGASADYPEVTFP